MRGRIERRTEFALEGVGVLGGGEDGDAKVGDSDVVVFVY